MLKKTRSIKLKGESFFCNLFSSLPPSLSSSSRFRFPIVEILMYKLEEKEKKRKIAGKNLHLPSRLPFFIPKCLRFSFSPLKFSQTGFFQGKSNYETFYKKENQIFHFTGRVFSNYL